MTIRSTDTILKPSILAPNLEVLSNGFLGELRQREQWVNWRVEFRDGKWTKPPIGKCNDPRTWKSFDAVVTLYQAQPQKIAGIGLVFAPDCPYCGVDIDDCCAPETKIIAPWALSIIKSIRSYTEVSPSGTGVKIICRGKWPGVKHRHGEIECYDRGRYFTMTGHVLEGCEQIRDAQDALNELAAQYFSDTEKPQPKVVNGAEKDSAIIAESGLPEDGDLVSFARQRRNGAKFSALWDGQSESRYGSQSEADMALCTILAFYIGDDAGRIDRLFRQSGLYRAKWDEKHGSDGRTYGEITVANAIDMQTKCFDWEQWRRRKNRKSSVQSGVLNDDEREINGRTRQIVVDVDQHRVVDEAVAFLETLDNVYQRGGHLVRITRDKPKRLKIRRPDGSATIEAIPLSSMRELLSYARWISISGADSRIVFPPEWVAKMVLERGAWSILRRLDGIVETPVLRRDGTVLETEGWDEETELVFLPNQEFAPLPAKVTQDDAVHAAASLVDLVNDFPFASPAHASAWLAGLLTLLARHAIEGCVPAMLIDANVAGSGKGLLADIAGLIGLGGTIPKTPYPDRDEELRKVITSLVVAGDRAVLFDNVAESALGGPAIDAAITADVWKDRILGGNQMTNLPMRLAFWFTANNVSLRGDIVRRLLYVRLVSPYERPEERSDFQRPNLLAYVHDHRGELTAAALTILKGYCDAGRPDQGLAAWGSFEEWSALVRSAIVWCGLPDPAETRMRLSSEHDWSNGMATLLKAWHALWPDQWLTAAELLERVEAEPAMTLPLRHAITDVFALRRGDELPSARSLGMKLNHHADGILDRYMLARRPMGGKHAVQWMVTQFTPPSQNKPQRGD
jgi:hypothetical protein